MNLSTYTTEELADELAKRPDLMNERGFTPFGLYTVLCKINPIPCTDGVAVRRNGIHNIEAMAIRRGTGPFKGRLCSVGGRLLRGETYEDCLRRQFRSDLGCEIKMLVSWRNPVTINQAYPLDDPLNDPLPSSDWGREIKKHTVANYYPVRLIGEPKFAATAHGGQEAQAVEWYTLDDLPAANEFGYGQRDAFVACLKAAEKLI